MFTEPGWHQPPQLGQQEVEDTLIWNKPLRFGLLEVDPKLHLSQYPYPIDKR
jgi:hypothetical protein